jgi:hypothetical protein
MVWVKSKEKIEFSIPGRPPCRGQRPGPREQESDYKKKPRKTTQNAYASVVAMIAKNAIATQNWNYDESSPVYIVITVNLPVPTSGVRVDRMERMRKNQELPVRYPQVDAIMRVIMYALCGVAYKNCKQIVSALVAKRYVKSNDQQSVDVLVGKPENWGELNYDLRNS